MPIVVYEDSFKFFICPNDHPPPHVHVKFTDGGDCRIDLLAGDFIDTPPRGTRRKIMEAYYENIERILASWEQYHPDKR